MRTNWSVGLCVTAVALSLAPMGPLMAQGNGVITLNCSNEPCDDVACGRAAFHDRSAVMPVLSVAITTPDRIARQTLDDALFLAGRQAAGLSVSLASRPPDGTSKGVEGWTTYRADGNGERIFVNTGSEIFRCASTGKNYQCQLRLASVLVHETWHFKNGGNEEAAYAAQIAFLMGNQGAADQISSVRRSRDRAVAAERLAIEAAKKR